MQFLPGSHTQHAGIQHPELYYLGSLASRKMIAFPSWQPCLSKLLSVALPLGRSVLYLPGGRFTEGACRMMCVCLCRRWALELAAVCLAAYDILSIVHVAKTQKEIYKS
jgi:hypothetical protein